MEFVKMVREEGRKLGIDAEMLKRPVNVGFSGGEKKRLETLQMAVLKPHRLQHGLPGYLILFDPHDFVPQRQSMPR